MNHKIIDNLKAFMETTYASEFIVLDTETDNKIEKKANLYGIGICFDSKEAFYIPIRKPTGEKVWEESLEQEFANWVFKTCSEKKLIGHNIIYDVLVLLYNWNLDFTSHVYSDTILQKHLLDSDRPHGLKETAVKYLGAGSDLAQKELYENIEANGGKTLKENIEMFKANTEVLGKYCAHDCLLTMRLFELFEPQIKEKNLTDLFYKDEIIPLYKECTIPMKIKGFPINVQHFENLNTRISTDLHALQEQLQGELKPYLVEYEKQLLNEMYPEKKGGLFPKMYAKVINFPLPEKNGKITLAKAEIAKLKGISKPEHLEFLSWLTGEGSTTPHMLQRVQKMWWATDGGGYIFNLRSNADLIHLFFTKLGYKPLSLTDGGAPQCDDDFLESVKKNHAWVTTLLDFKRLTKLKTTYIEGMLELHINGVIYTSLKQFGPPSGRYSCSSPNLQNIPRVKDEDSNISPRVLEYVNAIKEGFIAPEGYKVIGADFSQLEPRAFSEASGDALLQQSFINGDDLYGSIAKSIWNLECAPNDVKEKHKEYRQRAKEVALAVVYGAGAGRIAKLLNISFDEAKAIVDSYLSAYPQLKDYMKDCDIKACSLGVATTKFGRTVQLKNAQRLSKAYGMKLLGYKYAEENGLQDLRWKLKSDLNLAKNFPIQGVAAHVVNRSGIAIAREFKARGLDANLVLTVHDEWIALCHNSIVPEVSEIIKDKMENTLKLSVPLIAKPVVASNWAEAK